MENSKFLSACGRPPAGLTEDPLRYGARAGVTRTPQFGQIVAEESNKGRAMQNKTPTALEASG